MRTFKPTRVHIALTAIGVLFALCIPAAQASAEVPSWHLGQKNLSEVTGPVEYAASGTGDIRWGNPGQGLDLQNCHIAGSGTLGGKSSLTFEACEAYWEGHGREKGCDPLSAITIKFSASMESEKFTLNNLDEEMCIFGYPWVVQPGVMKLEVGKEAVKVQTGLSETTKFNQASGSITGSVQMSLTGSYTGKSFGGGPAPLVHMNGKTLAELGKTEASFTSSGSLKFEFPTKSEPTFSCTESGSGKLRARGLYQEEATLNCVVVGAETDCFVYPAKVAFVGSFESTAKVFVLLHTVDAFGHTCSVDKEIEIANPSGYFNYGAEANPLSVQRYATASGWGGVTISGETHWYGEGGAKLGIW